ncbi:MAG: HAMP domain-containing sensor histidine kinase [Gemmatimonadaceae bacterium]
MPNHLLIAGSEPDRSENGERPADVPTSARPRKNSVPLATALPMLTTFIVVSVLATAIVLSWITLRSVALDNAQERVDRAAQQLKVAIDNGMLASTIRGRGVARDSLVLHALHYGSPSATTRREQLDRELARMAPVTDSTGYTELWSANGRRIVTLQRGALEPLMKRVPEVARSTAPIPERFGMSSILATDSAQLSPLFDCEGHACYWTVMPVMEGDVPIGYVALLRQIAQNPAGERTIRGLTGGTLNVLLRNADADLWTSVFGQVVSPPRVDKKGRRFRAEVGEVLYADYAIAGAPFRLVTEVPRQEVVAPVVQTVRRLTLLGSLLTLAGALIAWFFGRRLARPLVTVTEAAGRVANGNFDIRVPTTGTEEMVSLAESFNHMAAQVGASLKAVESASRAKSDFMATMSHELRTPLNAIGGYVELMEMEIRGPVTHEQRHDLARIRQAQAHLLSLINAVLDLNRFERGQVYYDLVTLPLEPFLAGMDALVAPQAAAKALTLLHETSARTPCVVADREKLRQVLLNLLSNAIRYTPAGGRITLGAIPAPDDMVAIRVIDNGPGIPRERQEEIFEPFVQLDRSLTQSREGVGLGLAISRDLARGMGGDLRVESASGEGACFIVELPRGNVADVITLVATGEMQAQPEPTRVN